jgi:hypothetical protein
MKYFIPILVALFVMEGCIQKTPSITPNKESMLRTGRWKVTSGTITQRKPNGWDTTLNYMLFVPSCHTDDYIRFDSLNHAYVYSNTIKCSQADPDSISFVWRLLNNDQNMDILNVFNFFYMDSETINPGYFFDTLSQSPIVVLDTISTNPIVVLDSIWVANFIPILVDGRELFDNGINLYSTYISNFSQQSFTLSFKWYAFYADTTNHHTGGIDLPPIERPDTFLFKLNFTNF